MRMLTLALSTAALALSGTAVAQTASAPDRAVRGDMTRAQIQARAEARFARMDANQDGTVDQADRQARQAGMFERMDADRNGSISRAEFDAVHAKRAERRGKSGVAQRDGGRRAMLSAARGPLTRQAFVDRALTMFDRADADRDGTVTATERKAARESMRGQWRARAAERRQG